MTRSPLLGFPPAHLSLHLLRELHSRILRLWSMGGLISMKPSLTSDYTTYCLSGWRVSRSEITTDFNMNEDVTSLILLL